MASKSRQPDFRDRGRGRGRDATVAMATDSDGDDDRGRDARVGANDVMSTLIIELKTTDHYDFVKGNWKNRSLSGEENNNRVCTDLIKGIKTNGYDDPKVFADMLRDLSHKKLVFRCLARQMKMSEECSGDDLASALGAMNITDEAIIKATKLMVGGGAPYQVGGGFTLDVALALLLRMTNIHEINVQVLDAVLKVPNAIPDALSRLVGLSDCLKSFLGIGAGQSYYDILTNQIAGIYYMGTEYATAGKARVAEYAGTFKRAFNDWLSKNPIDAIGFMAVAMRYPGNIINLTVNSITLASTVIASTAVGATTFATTFVGDLWASEAGVMVCVLLYLYERNREQFNNIIGTITAQAKGLFIAGINGLGAIETLIIGKITDRAIIGQLDELRAHLQKFNAGLAKTETANMTAQTLKLVAEVASKTSKLNFEANQAVVDTRIITELTTALNNALTTEEAARVRHNAALAGKEAATRAHTDLVVGATLGQPPATPGAMAIPGGKSRSRKSHKKVSLTKRPKKSVHSRKAKGAKRSNKKY